MDIKVRLVQYLLKSASDYGQVINSEYRFQFGSRRADIVQLADSLATVFEIKSSRDNTERLGIQLESYKKYFDYCYVVCEPSNLDSVKSKTSHDVGIVVVSDDSVKYIRRSRQFKRLDKLSLASTLSTQTLKKITSNKRLTEKYALCQQLAKEKGTQDIRLISRKEMTLNILPIFSQFIDDIGDVIIPDDIYQLSRAPAKKLTKTSYIPLSLSRALEVI